MREGQVMLVRSFETRANFERQAKTGRFKAPKDHLQVMMYMGDVNAESIEHFNADGVLRMLGYGPQVWTAAGRRLVDALVAAREYLQPKEDQDDAIVALVTKIDEALAGAAGFIEATK